MIEQEYQREQQQEEDQYSSVYGHSNIGYNTDSIVKTRLDTRPILDKIELFLSASKDILEIDSEGNHHYQKVHVGEAKANAKGVQSMMLYLSTVINPQTVQGNFTDESYKDYLADVEERLYLTIIDKQYDWGINESEIHFIISSIMNFIVPFMSRLIGNKERDSYSHIRTIESNVVSRPHSGGGMLSKLNPFSR